MNFIKENSLIILLNILVLVGIAQIPEPVAQTFGDVSSFNSTNPTSISGVYAGPDVALVLSATNTSRGIAIISNNSTTTPPAKVLVCLSQVSGCTVANGIPVYASTTPLILDSRIGYTGPITVRAIASGTSVTVTER